jgi:hypothetical protein
LENSNIKTTSPTEEKEKFKSPKRRKKKLKITNIHMELMNISEFFTNTGTHMHFHEVSKKTTLI